MGQNHPSHEDILSTMKTYHPEAAVRMSGSRFAILSGMASTLERALGNFMMDMHVMKVTTAPQLSRSKFIDETQHGYTETSVPLIISQATLQGTGHLPKFEHDLFSTDHLIDNAKSYLVPTGSK